MIYEKLAEIQKNLTSYNFDRTTDYDTVVSTLRSELYKEELVAFFTIIEGAIILKVKSFDGTSDELSVRITREDGTLDTILKLALLQNTFLICQNKADDQEVEAATSDSEEEAKIEMTEYEIPKSILKIKEKLEDADTPTTRRNIALELTKYNMSTDARNEAKEFLKQFASGDVI